MHSLRPTKSFAIGVLALAAFLELGYLLATPPVVIVPDKIVTQWDSIWLRNKPAPCSAKSPAWCSGDNKEFLGCVAVKRNLGAWIVKSWQPASDMKRMATTVSGTCSVAFNGMWHLHPAEVDVNELHLNFFRNLSGQDLTTLYETSPPARVSLMTWAPGQLTAAVIWRGKVVYPVQVEVR